jgi:hypothetical protein
VRLFLPKEEFAEPVEINLKDARDVKAESLAYKVIPSMPRDVGCDKDGFRQGACQTVLQLCFMFAHDSCSHFMFSTVQATTATI